MKTKQEKSKQQNKQTCSRDSCTKIQCTHGAGQWCSQVKFLARLSSIVVSSWQRYFKVNEQFQDFYHHILGNLILAQSTFKKHWNLAEGNEVPTTKWLTFVLKGPFWWFWSRWPPRPKRTSWLSRFNWFNRRPGRGRRNGERWMWNDFLLPMYLDDSILRTCLNTQMNNLTLRCQRFWIDSTQIKGC